MVESSKVHHAADMHPKQAPGMSLVTWFNMAPMFQRKVED
jgi:hypothetical protein